MKLTDLEPRWVGITREAVGKWPEIRFQVGVSFLCPCCRDQRIAVIFANFIDPNNTADRIQWAWPSVENKWQRSGDTFETLTLTPSIDVSQHGHWHGSITNGEIA